MRTALLALACLLLAGCWYGNSLYAPSDAKPVIAPGVYRATTEGETERIYRVSILANGMTQFDGNGKKETYGFAPLGPASGTYVLWLPVKDEDKSSNDQAGEFQIYLLMVRVRDGEYRVYAPECKDAAAEIARKAGAVIETGSSAACRFDTRAQLEKALRMLPRDDSSAWTLSRIP